jgi:hypothetical protein
MKVKFLIATTYARDKYEAGQVAEIPNTAADVLIAKGVVTKVKKK